MDKSLRVQFAKTKSKAARQMEIIMRGGVIEYGKAGYEADVASNALIHFFLLEKPKNVDTFEEEFDEE